MGHMRGGRHPTADLEASRRCRGGQLAEWGSRRWVEAKPRLGSSDVLGVLRSAVGLRVAEPVGAASASRPLWEWARAPARRAGREYPRMPPPARQYEPLHWQPGIGEAIAEAFTEPAVVEFRLRSGY